MSKTVEKLVSRQLVSFLEENNLLPSLQSAYRKNHSTETAVLKVVSDILRASDRGDVTLLCLLDMSAAFDTVDHDLLIHRLSTAFGFQGKVLSWIESFICHRSQTVSFGGELSAESNVVCGVPQGSVLGPILFLLLPADVITIANHQGPLLR